MTRRRSDAPAAGTRLLPIPKVEDRLRPIAEEIHRLHESTVWSGQTQFGRLHTSALGPAIMGRSHSKWVPRSVLKR